MKTSPVLLFVLAAVMTGCRSVNLENRTGFASPELAVDNVVAALREDDVARLQSILGPEAEDVLHTEDPGAGEGRKRFLELYDEAHSLERVKEDRAILHIGSDDWPFPIPIVNVDSKWYLDTEEGREEITDRRIGRNELSMIQVALTLVVAQAEYADRDWDGDGLLEYAQKARSSPGQKDGLYWPEVEGEPLSPLGELAAVAIRAGYGADRDDGESIPFHGYFIRILRGQGPNAPGGAYDYMAGQHMLGGFASIAYPAEYGSTGIMSFLVSHDGIVYEQDLGEGTEDLAKSMTLFDPDSSWRQVADSDAEE